MTQQLAVYEHAREALAAAVRFDEVTQLRTTAQRAEAYARIANDRKLQADAAEIVARAERKLGIMLRKAKGDGLMSQGGRPRTSNLLYSGSGPGQPHEPETGVDAEPVFDNTPFTLAEIGVDKKLSSRAQKAAELDEDDFEEAIEQKRSKILSSDAAVVSAPKVRPVKVEKPAPVKPLEPRRFHQFAFSVLSLSVSSDRVGSPAIQFLARECGLLGQGEGNLDFTPEAEAAMGNILVAALGALGDTRNTPRVFGTAREASGGQPLPGDGDIGGLKQGAEPAPTPLSTAESDKVIRAGYEAEPKTSVAELAAAVGRPDEKGRAFVRDRARRMGLSSRANQRAAASAFATAQHAARRAGGA